MDPSIVITIGGYLVALSVAGDKLKKTDEPIQNVFKDPGLHAEAFVPSPTIFNQPVKDLQSRCNEIGLVPFGEPALLHILMAEFARTPPETYRETLVAWLRQYAGMLPQVGQWLSSRGLTLDDYISHLIDDGMANSLEVWLISLAMNTPINIVLKDVMWSTASTGIDFSFYMIILTLFGMAIPCLPEEPE